MLCATYDKFVGERIEATNDTPVYLILGAISVMVLAFIGGVLMTMYHPHDIIVVPEEHRLKPGSATLIPISIFRGVSERDSRRVRVCATMFLGFTRIVSRSAWQTVTIPLLVKNFGFTIWTGSIVFSCV